MYFNEFNSFNIYIMGLKINFSGSLEAGIDEAGRGSLAGPVTAAAVILPDNFNSEILDDSKKISKLKRNRLRKVIEKEAISFSVINVESKIIDEINILNATLKAMHLAIQNLKVIEIDTTNNLLIVKGSVPGKKNSIIFLKDSVKKSK